MTSETAPTGSSEPYRATYREYVEVIYELREEGIDTIQARIADWLGVSRASVSEMIHRMADDGLVKINGAVELTHKGRHLAEVVVRRHRLAERFLSEVLKLPWQKVHAEAEVWEHMVSDDVEKAMWELLEDPKTCPHGNPIPGAGYVPPKMKAISKMTVGESMLLERISEELELEVETMGFLDVNQLRPGARVVLSTKTPHGTLAVEVNGGSPVGMGEYVADRLFVAVE